MNCNITTNKKSKKGSVKKMLKMNKNIQELKGLIEDVKNNLIIIHSITRDDNIIFDKKYYKLSSCFCELLVEFIDWNNSISNIGK